MFARLTLLTTFVSLAACVAQEPAPITLDEAVQVIPPAPVEPEVVPDPVPDACEILLSRLDETLPLLADLDSSLDGQAKRIEDAVAEVRRPAPPSRARDCPTVSSNVLGRKEIIGTIEWVYMDPPGRHYRARIDSGAETSSLSASDIVEFERDGDDWVRFSFKNDGDDDAIEFELPIKRVALIRQPSVVDLERRVVVELDIRLGDRLQATEFSLTDRSQMTYPVLLGRSFLMDLYVVDVSQSYTHERYKVPAR